MLAAKFLPRRPPICLLRFSRWHNLCHFDTSAVRNVCNSRLCDRLRLYGNNSLYDRLRSAIRDPQSSAIIWKSALRECSKAIKACTESRQQQRKVASAVNVELTRNNGGTFLFIRRFSVMINLFSRKVPIKIIDDLFDSLFTLQRKFCERPMA